MLFVCVRSHSCGLMSEVSQLCVWIVYLLVLFADYLFVCLCLGGLFALLPSFTEAGGDTEKMPGKTQTNKQTNKHNLMASRLTSFVCI